MEGYPLGSLEHNVPLIVVSGLSATAAEQEQDGDTKGGVVLRSDIPPLETREADVLGEYLQSIDARGRSWSAAAREGAYKFRVKSVGRSYALPPRKAQLPESSEAYDATPVLHSPFSPLSPSSALYPDGLISRQWIEKHQDLVPSAYVCFYSLTADPTTLSLEDNRIKSNLNDIKSALAKSGYKTRLAVVLLADSESGSYPWLDGMQERVENIRKGAALDPKSIFYVPPQETPSEFRRAVDKILFALYNTSIEYYRDLGRHAKKKRSRGFAPQPTIPPTSGTSHTLSLPDWNFRYDFKGAVFSEFRQEMDAAIRAYEQAYEILLGEEVMDVIPNWSPRWNEVRQLSDIIVIRCLRLHLWAGSTSTAVRRWRAHRNRISHLVDRQGRGTNNYGWQAWEARWAMVMANLLEKIGIPGLLPSSKMLQLPPERSVMAERLEAWDLLHHTGYWYRLAARHLVARRGLAQMMPEEDRKAPESAPSSHAASKAYAYDVYMCPEPYEEYPLQGEGVNHTRLIVDCLVAAQAQFKARKQVRMAGEISLQCATEMASIEAWDEVVLLVQPLWDSMAFRSEWWLNIAEELCWLMRKAAAEAGRGDLVIAADWELMNKRYTRRPKWLYSLDRSLDKVKLDGKPLVNMSDETVTPLITASFVFRSKEGRAGGLCKAQLTLSSHAMNDSEPVKLTSLKLAFDGSLKPIVLEHDESGDTKGEKIVHTSVDLSEESPDASGDDGTAMIRGACDLTISAGQVRVFEMMIPLREAGEAEAETLTLSCHNDSMHLDYTIKFRETDPVVGWYVRGSPAPRHARVNARMLHIHPRPPKMEIRMRDLANQYYANEPLQLKFELVNAEDETANVKLDFYLSGPEVPRFAVTLGDEKHVVEEGAEEPQATGLSAGSIDSSSSSLVQVDVDPSSGPRTYDIHVRATYHLVSDMATPIIQELSVQLNVVNAFEANYDLVPRLHRDPWPSLFDSDNIVSASGSEDEDGARPAAGLAQKWCLICHYASFATEDIRVVGMELKVLSTVGEVQCTLAPGPDIPDGGQVVSPKTMHEAQFDLITQKMSLEDRQPVSLELAFVIRWRRGDNTEAPHNETTMPVGRYLVLGSEPRVLASVVHAESEGIDLVHMELTIENPSNHLLTFGLTMEPSNEFAFSGSKQTTMHLLPLSRRSTMFRLLPLVRGAYVRPALTVRDKYFQKVLRIIPTEGMKIDKDGLLVWIPGGEDEDEADAEAGEDVEE
ncbi:Gryzun, putative trafficking through golgi-domain-containing protein [Stachybotrys elegans]|uniref:Gryzun, putative trafficking through golgi-domain-containing protein n=1 Tax=Stachybotrys elegans TaxID=80388 RepID=A0A8K0SHH3_9HYPO|nr:Gryzun, putative trafficking through golgi-domain-containing protein [Stachybotrys elegans]